MRVRDSMCKRMHSLHTKFAVDLSYMMTTNLLSISSIIIWSFALSVPLSYLVAVDVLLGLATERWLKTVLINLDNTAYHPGGTIGRAMIQQRMCLLCVIALMLRGNSAALSRVDPSMYEYDTDLSYSVKVFAVPTMYTFLRCIFLDIDLYHPGSTRVNSASEEEDTGFPITDQDEDTSAAAAASEFTIEDVDEPTLNPVCES